MEINEVTLTEKIRKSSLGESLFFRSGWIADYPHPQNFLSLLYGREVPDQLGEVSYPNTARYVNPDYDALYEKGMNASSLEESYRYFIEAESLAMKDAPYIVLFYAESYRFLQPYIRNLPNNQMQYRDFSETWIDFDIFEQLPGDEAGEPEV